MQTSFKTTTRNTFNIILFNLQHTFLGKIPVNVKKLNDNAILPTYGSANAAGADLYACLDGDVTIEPGDTFLVKTGLAMELPEGYA